MSNQNKLFTTIGILFIALVIFTGFLDEAGHNYTEEGIKRSLVTYGIARGLNGVISVAQGTEVAIEPVGVGVTFAPGEILDPINDLIERFSWIVLASSVSLGAQSILLNMTEWQWFGVLVGALLLTSLVTIWHKSILTAPMHKYLYKMTLILVILRLMVPLVSVVNQGVYQAFLEPQYLDAKQELEQTTLQLEESTQQPELETEDLGLIERAKQLFDDASEAMTIDTQIEELKTIAADISQSVLNMMVVFVLQTLVFPLLFLWLTYRSIVYIAKY